MEYLRNTLKPGWSFKSYGGCEGKAPQLLKGAQEALNDHEQDGEGAYHITLVSWCMNDLVHGTGTQILSADSHLEAFARLRDELEKFDSVVFIGPGTSASWNLPP